MITKASVTSFDGLFRSSEYSIHIAGIRSQAHHQPQTARSRARASLDSLGNFAPSVPANKQIPKPFESCGEAVHHRLTAIIQLEHDSSIRCATGQSSAVEIACPVSDQTCVGPRPITSPSEPVQHRLRPALIQLEHYSAAVAATSRCAPAGSSSVEFAARVSDQTRERPSRNTRRSAADRCIEVGLLFDATNHHQRFPKISLRVSSRMCQWPEYFFVP